MFYLVNKCNKYAFHREAQVKFPQVLKKSSKICCIIKIFIAENYWKPRSLGLKHAQTFQNTILEWP